MVALLRAVRLRALLLFLLAFGLGVLSTCTAASSSASAQSSPKSFSGISTGATPEGFRYMSGGIGLEEREIMESWGADYNVKLAFAELSGNYVSDVKVVMEDQNGKDIISATTNGPWLYVRLPPGTYNVKATFEGEIKEIRDLRLSEGDRVLRYLHWEID